MLYEMSGREGQIVQNLKKNVSIKTELIGTKNRLMIARGEGGQKAQNFQLQSKCHGAIMCIVVVIVTAVYLKVAESRS